MKSQHVQIKKVSSSGGTDSHPFGLEITYKGQVVESWWYQTWERRDERFDRFNIRVETEVEAIRFCPKCVKYTIHNDGGVSNRLEVKQIDWCCSHCGNFHEWHKSYSTFNVVPMYKKTHEKDRCPYGVEFYDYVNHRGNPYDIAWYETQEDRDNRLKFLECEGFTYDDTEKVDTESGKAQ